MVAAWLALPAWGETEKPSLQEFSLGEVIGAGNRCLISGRCLIAAANPAKHVRSDGVEEVIVFEFQILEHCQCGVGSLDLGHRDGAIDRHDRTRSNDQELVVQ